MYILSFEKLVNLEGHSFKPLRRHVSHFIQTNSKYEFRKLNISEPDDLKSVFKLLESWVEDKKFDDTKLAEEKFNRPIKTFLEQEFGQIENEKILDVGSGLYSETYLPEGRDVYSVDWLPQVKKIKNSYVCNAESLPFGDNEFGMVLSKQVYGYLVSPEKCLDEMVRVLKPDGLLIIVDWKGNLKGDDFRVEDFERNSKNWRV